MTLPRRTLSFLLAAVLLPAALPARAQQDEHGPTPPRLSYLDGQVSFWRPGAEDWAAAHVNTPLAEGDSVYTDAGANVELQVGHHAYVRAGESTQLGLDGLENDLLQFKLTGGHVALDLRESPGRRVEVDTPAAAVIIDHPGYYRVIVGEAGTKLDVRNGGGAIVTPEGGQQATVGDGTEAVIEGNGVQTQAAPQPDAWDQWNFERDQRHPQQAQQYVPDNVYGTDELQQYGTWRAEPQYGNVWYPTAVAAGWTPYSAGRWIWDPFYGWSWVDDAPWGWAPFHYGRWVFGGGGWGWAPGPIVSAAVYAPALVAFFGPVAVSVGVPFVSWVPLAWGEPCFPWWGGYVGHPWWGGWGGPHVNITNVTNINVYRNTRVNNGIVSVQREGFGRGRIERARLDEGTLRNMRPVRGAPNVRPQPASLIAGEGRGHRPPEQLQNRQVVATRQPRDNAERLRQVGLTAPAARPEVKRIVSAPARVQSRPAAPGAPGRSFENASRGAAPPPHPGTPGGQSQWVGKHPERPQPPPPPHHEHVQQNLGGSGAPAGSRGTGGYRAAREPGYEPHAAPPPRGGNELGRRAEPPPVPQPRQQYREPMSRKAMPPEAMPQREMPRQAAPAPRAAPPPHPVPRAVPPEPAGGPQGRPAPEPHARRVAPAPAHTASRARSTPRETWQSRASHRNRSAARPRDERSSYHRPAASERFAAHRAPARRHRTHS
jgi:hypothetical protein